MSEDLLLNQALSRLTEVSEMDGRAEIEDVARVRKARASVTEHARQTGDSVGNLLSGLLDESNAELESEKAEKERRAREAEERLRAEQEAEEARKLDEARKKLEEEKRKLEEKGERRTMMLAAIEKKRKEEAGEIDEEEEARKRAEAEAEAARKAAEKAREEAEAALLQSSNEELAEQIRIMKANKAAEEQAEANKKQKIKLTRNAVIIVAAVAACFAAVMAYTAHSAAKQNAQYVLMAEYQTRSLTMRTDIPTSSAVEVAYNEVTQTNPQTEVKKKKHSEEAAKQDNDNKIKIKNVFDEKGPIQF